MSDQNRESQMDTIPIQLPELELIQIPIKKEITFQEAFGYDPNADPIDWENLFKE